MSTFEGSETPIEIACTLEVDAMPDRLDAGSVCSPGCAHVRRRRTAGFGSSSSPVSMSASSPGWWRPSSSAARSSRSRATVDRRGIALEVDAPEAATEIVIALFGTA